jgi:hypothetical protein
MRPDRVKAFWRGAGVAVFQGELRNIASLTVHPLKDGAYLWVVWDSQDAGAVALYPILAGGRCRGRTKGTAIAEGVRRLIAMEHQEHGIRRKD